VVRLAAVRVDRVEVVAAAALTEAVRELGIEVGSLAVARVKATMVTVETSKAP